MYFSNVTCVRVHSSSRLMAASAHCIAEEETNFLRFGTGIIHVCPNALRAYFDTRHPNLAADLQANKALLQSLRNRIITNDQWDLLFPSTGKVFTKVTY